MIRIALNTCLQNVSSIQLHIENAVVPMASKLANVSKAIQFFFNH
jgi:hypothetical protein